MPIAEVDGRGHPDFGPLHRQDVADQHVSEVLRLSRGLAHRQNHGSRGHGVRDADDGFLRDVRLVALDHREDERADEREGQAHPVDRGFVRIVALPDGDRRAQRRDLREREVHEDDAALDDVQAQVGVDARDDERGGDRRKQELKDRPVHPVPTFPSPA